MTIVKTAKGWLVDIQPGGRRGKRVRKSFDTKAEAQRFELLLRKKTEIDREWNPRPTDKRMLSELVNEWFETHGRMLKDGEGRRRILELAIERMGDSRAVDFTASQFTAYRNHRLREGITPNTVNHEHAYLRAVFNELARMGRWEIDNPLGKVRRLKFDEPELKFLSTSELTALLSALNESPNADVALVAEICLKTGARWSEAEGLKSTQVLDRRIQFSKTKSGRLRVVPIDVCLHTKLLDRGVGKLFEPCYNAFRFAIKKVGMDLPDGQLTHVLRHTFASHFMMNGGNILTLQRILGHASITMTMRYSHLAPEHLEEAVKRNPLSN